MDSAAAVSPGTKTLTKGSYSINHNNSDYETDVNVDGNNNNNDEESIHFQNHFSVGIGEPFSTIRFRNNNNKRIMTYGLDREDQIIVQVSENTNAHQKKDDTTITVKYRDNATCGLFLLRATYSLVSLLLLGFLWAFCMQVVLFLFVNVFAQGGSPITTRVDDDTTNETTTITTQHVDVSLLIGSLLSIPVFLFGFASMLAIGNSVVMDTWNGSPLFGQLLGFSSQHTKVVMEIICFLVFLGIPGMTMALGMLMKNDDWWELTLSVWAVDILVYMAMYALLVVWTETRACLELTRLNSMLLRRRRRSVGGGGVVDVPHHHPTATITTLLTEAIQTTQIMFYGGYERVLYLVSSSSSSSSSQNNDDDNNNDDNEYAANNNDNDPYDEDTRTMVRTKSSWYSKWTATKCSNSFFRTLTVPEKCYSLDDIQEVHPFFTSSYWSLERMFCRSPTQKAVFVTHGRSALRKDQIVSTLWCVLFAVLLVILLLVGLLVYMDFGSTAAVIGIPLLIVGCCLLPIVMMTGRLYWQMYGTPTKMAMTIPNNNNNNQHLESNHGDWDDDDENDDDDDDEILFQVWENQRISEPQPWFVWFCFGISQILFFLLPLLDFMWQNKNYRVGVVFVVMALFSWPRLYLHPIPLLKRYGSIGHLQFSSPEMKTTTRKVDDDNNNDDNDDDEGVVVAVVEDPLEEINNTTTMTPSERKENEYLLLRKRARLSKLITKVNNPDSMACWMWFFGILTLIAGLFCLSASTQNEAGFDYKVKVPYGQTFLGEGFYYKPQPFLPYPTCRVSKDFDLLVPPSLEEEAGGDSSTGGTPLMDIAYLAAISFAAPNESVPLLNQWFGTQEKKKKKDDSNTTTTNNNPWDRIHLNTTIVDEYEFVEEWKRVNQITTPTSFKFFTFPQNPGVGLVSIRGSESLLDWLVDAQLWMGAVLAQIVRALLPLGHLFNPLLDDLVTLINLVENENLRQVSYYRVTTQFVNDMKSGWGGRITPYDHMRVTGASLGGGLAIITGAQTNATTVAISGINSMLSRNTYRPMVTKEALNTHIMNVVPDRDPIARIDDAAALTIHTQCRAPQNSLMGCHSMWRSVCEISYQCGSMGRPILCWCTKLYGYPDPEPYDTTNGNWTEACKNWN